jgi:3-oxoacyl-[acyl-carrier protein] reductase
MENQESKRRIAVITGAGQGMGRATALRLAEEGLRVVVNDLSIDRLDETLSILGSRTPDPVPLVGDVTDQDQVVSMFDSVRDRVGTVDVLINNAGVLLPTRFLEIGESEWDLVVGVNLRATFLCMKAVVGGMIEQNWGRIVNMSSTAGKSVSTIGGAHYTASKAAVLGLTRAVAKETAGDGVTVNAVCPGLIDTEMTRLTISAQETRAYERSFPIPRLGEPEEVADMIAFLVSDKAAYVTGASLDINGGDLMV